MRRSVYLSARAGASAHRGQVSAVGPDNAGRLAQQNGRSRTTDWPSCRQTLREDCYLWQTRSWPVATSCRTTSAVFSADIADESITCFS